MVRSGVNVRATLAVARRPPRSDFPTASGTLKIKRQIPFDNCYLFQVEYQGDG